MKFKSSAICVCALLILFCCQTQFVSAESGLDIEKVLAVVPVTGKDVDQSVYKQFDRLVPELRKISKSKIIKLECRYSGRTDRPQDVERAYMLAARIERYLRVRHKLDLDMWVAIDITGKTSKSAPAMTIAVFSDEIKQLDAVPVDPQKSNAQ
jgi:hypothetical protein